MLDEKTDAARVAVTPDGRALAIAIENNLSIYNGITQQKDVEIKAVFSSEYWEMGGISYSTFAWVCCQLESQWQLSAYNDISFAWEVI